MRFRRCDAALPLDDHVLAGNPPSQRPARIHTTGQCGGAFDTGLYSFDGAGNVTAMGSSTFTYDPCRHVPGIHVLPVAPWTRVSHHVPWVGATRRHLVSQVPRPTGDATRSSANLPCILEPLLEG